MEPISRFNRKVRARINGQITITIPKTEAHKFKEDQPVTIEIYPMECENEQKQL